MRRVLSLFARWLALLLLAALALQLYFFLRIAAMLVIDPQSTTFQRSEAWRLLGAPHWHWSQRWLPGAQISPQLGRAVIAAEDAGFAEHSGVEWDALERAWERNQRSELRAERFNSAPVAPRHGAGAKRVEPKLIGGSTITQQLAKNLFLSGERAIARKGQEFVITLMLEALLSKQRILEIYLNSVEWGEGVFGAEAASRHYFRIGAQQLARAQAARLAVMLPAPKRFEKRPDSPYVVGRAAVIAARIGDVELPQ